MRYAFLHKNFRELNFEKKVIFVSHILTVVLCFFPWFEYDIGDFSPASSYNAFGGPGAMIGFIIALISFVIGLYFLDRLFESERVELPVSENSLFFGASLQQLLLIVLAWSVLSFIGREYSQSAIRFGIFLAFVAQVTALVATFLNIQLDRQHQAQSFFNNPHLKNDHQE